MATVKVGVGWCADGDVALAPIERQRIINYQLYHVTGAAES
jgi:hypothetical protein